MSSDTERLIAGTKRLTRLNVEQQDQLRRARKARRIIDAGEWRDAVAERITNAVRRSGGITALSRAHGIPLNSLSNWTSGLCVPSVSQAIKLAKATKTPLSELVASDVL